MTTSHVCEQWQQPPFICPAWSLSKGRVNCPTGCGKTWTAIWAFDLTWKELIDFCVTGSVRGKKKKRCLLVISQHVQKYLRERRREGMKREITSHPTTSLLNYNNLTHMGRPLWQRERGGESLCGGGEGGSLLWKITHLTSSWGKERQIWCATPLGVQPGGLLR